MRVVILGAETGGGHKSVMKALSNQFKKWNIIVEEYPSFYEDLYESNRILSNFYNMSQSRSMQLGVLLNEIMVMEGEKQRERLYTLYLEALNKFFSDKCDVIISVSSLINYHIIRFFKEKRVEYSALFYVVVTDPYNPMYPGFDVVGATKYFCPTQVSKEQLMKSLIPEDKIYFFGYPVKSEFFYITHSKDLKEKLGINKDIVIMINCGMVGSFSFFDLITELVQRAKHIYFLVICGKNKVLFNLVNRNLSDTDNCKVFGYVDEMVNLYQISDICITKPGANAIFEALITETIPFVYDFEGLMYQEKGIHDYLSKIVGIDVQFADVECMNDYIINNVDVNIIKHLKEKVNLYKQPDASYEIVKMILQEYSESKNQRIL